MARRKRTPKIVENVKVIALGHKGQCIAKSPEGETYMIQGALPGDRIDAILYRKRKGMWTGRVHRMIESTPARVAAVCAHFNDCGGCRWQDLDYAEQLRQKEQIAQQALQRIGGITVERFLPILGADRIYHYRNKMEYSCSAERWLTEAEISSGADHDRSYAIGFHRPGAWSKIVDIQACHLQDQLSDRLRNALRSYARQYDISFYHPRSGEGLVRSLIVRLSRSGQCMVTVVCSAWTTQSQQLMDYFKEHFPQISSLYYVINNKVNDSLYDLEFIHYAGSRQIIEQLGEMRYVISPKSFFQTNSYQAERLYDIIKDRAQLEGHETLYDLYSGTGSIACYLARDAGQVIGIETIDEAIEDARANAELNNLDNTYWYAGDVKDLMTPELIARHGAPDVIILDPPRAGVHEAAMRFIADLSASRIVYVSCNPSTQARDLKILDPYYRTVSSQAVDMFPHTDHVENVVLLERRV